ncbi:hypothetical protein EJB05_37078, partial [Eragrostis curvula]
MEGKTRLVGKGPWQSMPGKGIGCIRRQKCLEQKTSEKAVPQPFETLDDSFFTQDMDSDVHDTSYATMNQTPANQMEISRLSQYEQGSYLDYLESLYNNPQLHAGYTDLLMEQIRNSQEGKNDQQAPQVSGCARDYEMFGGLQHNNSEQSKHNLDSTQVRPKNKKTPSIQKHNLQLFNTNYFNPCFCYVQCKAHKSTYTELLLADNPMDDHYGLDTGISEDNPMLFNNYNFVDTNKEYGQTYCEATSNAQEASNLEGSSVHREQNNQFADCESWGVGIFDAINLEEIQGIARQKHIAQSNTRTKSSTEMSNLQSSSADIGNQEEKNNE